MRGCVSCRTDTPNHGTRQGLAAEGGTGSDGRPTKAQQGHQRMGLPKPVGCLGVPGPSEGEEGWVLGVGGKSGVLCSNVSSGGIPNKSCETR